MITPYYNHVVQVTVTSYGIAGATYEVGTSNAISFNFYEGSCASVSCSLQSSSYVTGNKPSTLTFKFNNHFKLIKGSTISFLFPRADSIAPT